MRVDSDLHNCGQQVTRIDRGSGSFFQKPRSIYWEWLFFGSESPLRPIFSKVGANGQAPLSSFFFNLDIEFVQDWLGYARDASPSSHVTAEAHHFYSFGALLAYAYLFGIRDLHRDNLVLTGSHIQVIDAEVVLTRLLLPHETLLLPFKGIPSTFAGISLLTQSSETLRDTEKVLILAGFTDIFDLAYQSFNELSATMTQHQRPTPIRVIIRNTAIYRATQNGVSPSPELIKEEQRQLDRGDIPYFFKKLGDMNLYWMKAWPHSIEKVVALNTFSKDVNRHAIAFDRLYANREDIRGLMIRGLLFLQKRIGPEVNCELTFNSKALSLSANSISLGEEVFSSK